MGATLLEGLVGDAAISRKVSGTASYWVAESGAVTASDAVFDQVVLTPKTVGALTTVSRKMILQSSPAIEQILKQDLADALGGAIDLAAINGSGASNQPKGILKTTGIGDVAGGTNGGIPTWPNVVNILGAVADSNADTGAMAFLTNSKVRSKLLTVEKASGTARFVWEYDAKGQGIMAGIRAEVSNNIPSNLSKGTGSNLSAIICGNFRDLLIGSWGVLEVMSDPYTNFSSGDVQLRALMDIDINVRHAASFAAMQDAITT